MNLTKLILVVLSLTLTTCVSRSQNMTVTLGTGGLFTIKDASNNYLTLNQSTGQIRLLGSLRLDLTGTSSTTGVIFKGTNRFLHDFRSSGSWGDNIFIGLYSGNFSMSGSGFYSSENTGVGFSSLTNLTTGYCNSAVGWRSLTSTTTGHHNSAFGHQSGANINSGSNLTCLGYNAQPTSSSATNQITLGDNYVTLLRCKVTTITALSDARDKKNIKDLNLGLDFLMKLKPRLFNWDRRDWYEDNKSDGSKMEEELTAGFIAQELDDVQKTQNAEWLNLVVNDNPDKLEATPGNLFPIMVKAIQELKIENDELKEKLAKFEQMQNYLANEIEKLKSKEGEILKTGSK
ncbi:tail fiber domain-containing protein [Bacteroidota bacterium]